MSCIFLRLTCLSLAIAFKASIRSLLAAFLSAYIAFNRALSSLSARLSVFSSPVISFLSKLKQLF
jgi:hypothetical protein